MDIYSILAWLIFLSPAWTSLLILFLARRHLAFTYLICGFQVALGAATWWFYWGGGIGGEAHLGPELQALCLLVLLPVIAAIAVRRKRRPIR
jgi:hypothetical protein